jgi:hypothetical protein
MVTFPLPNGLFPSVVKTEDSSRIPYFLAPPNALRPDFREVADSWRKGALRSGKLSPQHKPSWEEHAKRLGLFPVDIERGWEYLNSNDSERALSDLGSVFGPLPKPTSGPPVGAVTSRASMREALNDLKCVFGEATSWWGYSVPHLLMLRTPQNPVQANPGFGFHTPSAQLVWDEARKLADENPKAETKVIINAALERAKVMVTELTPEDAKLLDMAINWYISGKIGSKLPDVPQSNVRSGGMPGGPFRSNTDGHHLASRGAP